MATKLGELNGPWAFLMKITLSVVPIICVTGIAGVTYQLRFNAKVEAFMSIGDRYTQKMASDDLNIIRSDFEKEIRLLEKADEANRIALQNATPEADRRLKSIEASLGAIQTDIVAMRISLAQIRMNDSKETKTQP